MYPDVPLFQLGNRKDGTGDDYASANADADAEDDLQVEIVTPEQQISNTIAANATVSNITNDAILEKEPDDKNNSNEEKNLDLFKKQIVSSPPQHPAVQTEAVLIEMLDFELTLTFTEPQRRLLRSFHSSFHHQHRQTQGQARNFIVKDTLTKFFNEFYAEQLSGQQYAPLNHGEKERVIVSKSSISSELYDLSSTSVWSGVTIFLRTDKEQRLPTEFTVQAIQLQALADESGFLFSALKGADAEGISGLDRLESVKASSLPYETTGITERESFPADFEYSPNSANPSITLQSQSPAGFDSFIFVALIIASLSFAFLAIALFIAYRRSRAGRLHPRQSSPNYTKQNQWKVRDARPDEIPQSSSGGFNTIASSASPMEGVQPNTDGEDADDEMSLPSELPASVDRADGASVSAFSDVSSLGHVIQDAIQTYQNNVGNHSTCTPDSQDTFFQRFASAGAEEESVGVVSIDDSSQLGALSVAGYSLNSDHREVILVQLK